MPGVLEQQGVSPGGQGHGQASEGGSGEPVLQGLREPGQGPVLPSTRQEAWRERSADEMTCSVSTSKGLLWVLGTESMGREQGRQVSVGAEAVLENLRDARGWPGAPALMGADSPPPPGTLRSIQSHPRLSHRGGAAAGLLWVKAGMLPHDNKWSSPSVLRAWPREPA